MPPRYDPDRNPWDPPIRDYSRLQGPRYPTVNHAKHRKGALRRALEGYFAAPGNRPPTREEWLRGRRRKG